MPRKGVTLSVGRVTLLGGLTFNYLKGGLSVTLSRGLTS